MKIKILLLFPLLVFCLSLNGQTYTSTISGNSCFQDEMITSGVANAGIGSFWIQFANGKGTHPDFQPADQNDILALNKGDLTITFTPTFNYYVSVQKYGWKYKICPGQTPTSSLLYDKTFSYNKKSGLTFYGTALDGTEVEIKTFHNVTSGNMLIFTDAEFQSLRRYTNIRIQLTQEEAYTASEINFSDRIVSNFSINFISAVDVYDNDRTDIRYDYTYGITPTIVNSTSIPVVLIGGEFATKITNATVNGSTTTNNALNISNSGTGIITLTACNLSSMIFDLSNVDFGCQVIKNIELQDASGNIRNTFSAADYQTVGTNQIALSLLNIPSIVDNDRLIISLSNECTLITPEMDYTIVLSTGSKDQNVAFINKELYPDGANKVPIAISPKNGTIWCDYSPAYFFNVSGPNGYTNINFSNASSDGSGAYSVAKGQTSIVGQANFFKCLTPLTIPIPTTHMPKAPVIADVEYCNGNNIDIPINNPTDYTTETFRLLFDGLEKVGWQGTKTFTALNLEKVGTSTAIVESTNGECTIASNSATIASRIQPVALAFVGSLSYYTEQVNTTIVQTSQQDGVTYKIYKVGSATPLDKWIGTKAQTLTKGSYRITAENANVSCTAETNLVIVEKDLNIGSAWVTTDLSFCQLEGTKDLNTFVSFNAPTSVTYTSTSGLSINGSIVNLVTSVAGTYTITATVIKDGVTKIFTKDFTVKPKANDIALILLNSTDFACNTDAAQLQVTTDYPSYTYTWYKGVIAQSGNLRTNTIPLTKAEGVQNFTVVGTAPNGCLGSPSSALTLIKNNLTADINFTSGINTYCQSIGGAANIFDDLTGSDKLFVSQEQGGYIYNITSSSTDLIIINRNQIDLERTKAGTYTITMAYSQNGCTKTITKQYTIKQMPSSVTITLDNASTIECDQNNVNALVHASNSTYSYNWYKKGISITDNTQAVSIPVSKADGLTNIFAYPVVDGCIGLKSNEVSLTKRYVIADVAFSTSVIEYCQKTGGSVDLFTELSGTDKIAVINSQSGYTWVVTPSGSGLKMTGSVINLEISQAGTYTITLAISKDGCSKTITKDIMIRQRPADFTIALTNSMDFACNASDAALAASVTSYTYAWYKAGALAGSGTTINIPVTKLDVSDASRTMYAIGTASNGCETNPSSNLIAPLKTFLETNLSISSGTASFCQSPIAAKTDIFDFLSGTDKLAVTTNQHYTWSIVAPGLVLASTHEIDLFNSAAGTYNIAFTYQNDAGCAKTLNKTIVINPKPSVVAITLDNASTVECDLANPSALVHAENSAYTYNWTKNGTLLSDNTQAVSIPVSKADGLTSIYAVPVLNGCVGLKTNTVSLTKKYVDADLAFFTSTGEFCQTVGTTLDMRTLLSGADKDKVTNEQNGYTWDLGYSTSGLLFTDAKNSIINLEKSFAQTYTSSLNVHKDGCSKTLTKDVKIKPRPISVDVTLQNADNLQCNTIPAQFKAAVAVYDYQWYGNGNLLSEKTSNLTLPIAKADGLISVYAIPVLDGCVGVQTNAISTQKLFVEADLTFSTGVTSYCQYPKTTVDLFTELSGVDKLAIQQKQNGWGWTFTGSTPDLVISGSNVNLETSAAGTYTVSMIITKDGCSKTITKTIVIKERPTAVAITLDNASTIECDQTNPNALVQAENSAYTYNWYKNGTLQTGSTQSLSIPVSKADGLTSIYAIPVLDGCVGLKSNEVSLTKKYVQADFGFNNTAIILASKDETINLFDYTVGKDKDAIINQTGGFTYKMSFAPVKQTTISTTDGSIVPSTGLQSGDTQYLLNVVVSKDGCDLNLSKTATIKAIPRNVTIDFVTAQSTQECTSNNYINVVASDSTSSYVYNWYKNDVLVSGQSTYKASIEVFKSDGTVKIYAIPSTKDGYAGYKTNILTTTKRYVTADLQLDQTTETLCSVAGKKINIFDYVRGNDKAAVLAGQYAYSYTTAGDCGTAIANNQYVDVDNSLADDNLMKTVSLTVSQNGCSVTQNKTFIIKRRPSDITIELLSKASNTSNNNLFCGGDTLSLHVSTSNSTDVSYDWFKNGSLIGKTTTPSFVYPFTDASGLITLSATSVYSNSCQSTASNVITVQKKDVNFNIDMASDPVAYCPDTKRINLFDYVSGTDKNDVMSQSNNCSYEFTASGNNGLAVVSYYYLDLDNSTYSVNPYTLTFNVNKQGCTKAFTKNVSIKPRPVTPLIALTSNSELRFCSGDGVAFTDKNAVTGTTYKWNVNGTDYNGTGVFKFETDTTSDLIVQATSYLNSNSCPSKGSNIVSVTNVLPKVEIKLMSQNVTVNDIIQFYIFEPIASKNITLTAVRTSDKSVTDLMYTREGNVITLKGTLPIGTYTFSAVAENALAGYCSQNIAIANTLTVTNSTNTKANSNDITQAEELARKSIFDEYMLKLKKGEINSILLPILSTSLESAKLCVFTTYDDEYVYIHVFNMQGKEVSTRSSYLTKGENDFMIESNQKPIIPGMYFIKIDYSKAGRTETLKGLIKN